MRPPPSTDGYNPPDDRDPPVGSRRCPACPNRWHAAAGGRRPRRGAADRRRAVRLHARRRAALRDAPPADRGARLDLARRGDHADGRRRAPPRRREGHDHAARRRPARTDYEVWISDGDLVRTYSSTHRLGTQRPIRNRPRGLDDRDFPGTAKVYEPVTALPTETLPETFVHPAGYCQNVLATGRCMVSGTEVVIGREAILRRVRPPAHDRAVGRPAGLPHLDRGRSRRPG